MTLAAIPHAKQRVKISNLISKIINQQSNPYFFFCTKTRLKYSSSTVKSSAVEIHKLFSTALELTKNNELNILQQVLSYKEAKIILSFP